MSTTSHASLLSALIKRPVTADTEKAAAEAEFNAAASKLVDIAKCVPDDKEELEEEKQMWMLNWGEAMVRVAVCQISRPTDQNSNASSRASSAASNWGSFSSSAQRWALPCPAPTRRSTVGRLRSYLARKQCEWVSKRQRGKALPCKRTQRPSRSPESRRRRPNRLVHDHRRNSRSSSRIGAR
jgi:hypothetical protein